MLLRFGFENVCSFRDRTELSFVATALEDEPRYTLTAPGVAHGVLPALALYGANASGKSNIVAVMQFFWGELRRSFLRDAEATIPRTPFLLRPNARAAPSRLDCDVLINGVRYHYGFEIDDREVRQEWLYAWSTHRRTVLFHRQGIDRQGWYFGSSLKGRNGQIADFTRDNCLFLSAAAQHNHAHLREVHATLGALMSVGDATPAQSGLFLAAEAPVLQEEHRRVVGRMLREADLGIADLRVREPEVALAHLVNDISLAPGDPKGSHHRAQAGYRTSLSLDADPRSRVELGHLAEHGIEFFKEEQESLGTRMLLKLLNPVLRALAGGTCLVLDELGTCLHPRLVAALVGLFTHEDSNPHGAQLLFTTHDSLFMDQLRRDEIGLVEKDTKGCSTLRNLSDYDLRQRDNWRKGYEAGRFGGVPILGEMGRALGRG